jgi:prepilin-type N-terminal cleavage/methylation domain-containing protein/prepilin-type processing-associated H-X9-DG protein
MSHRQRYLRRGFTLVELLVVVAIISILLAILMPALAASRRQAQLLVCSNNMRSIVQAAHQYAADNGNRVPRDATTGGWPTVAIVLARYLGSGRDLVDPYSFDWLKTNPYHELAKDIERLRVFTCPALPETIYEGLNDGYEIPSHTEPKFPVHYTTNGIFFAGYRSTGMYLPPSPTRQEKGFPANAVYVAEMPHNIYPGVWQGMPMSATWCVYHPGQMTFDDRGQPNPYPNMVWSTDRHHGDKTPLAFWDGHVEVRRITRQDLPVQLLNPYHPLAP